VEERLGIVSEGHVLAEGDRDDVDAFWMEDSKPAGTVATSHSVDQQTMEDSKPAGMVATSHSVDQQTL
jgi:hypothetical protein